MNTTTNKLNKTHTLKLNNIEKAISTFVTKYTYTAYELLEKKHVHV